MIKKVILAAIVLFAIVMIVILMTSKTAQKSFEEGKSAGSNQVQQAK